MARRGLKTFMRVSEAARFLGVSASTLRNWDREGKVRARRHPVNGYRLYVQADLARLLNRLQPRRIGRRDARENAVRKPRTL
jgi:excisionase family DNA binding protein